MKNTIVSREKLGKAIQGKNMNYSDLGRIFAVSRSTICRKMSGERPFNEAEISELVKLFGKKILNLPNK